MVYIRDLLALPLIHRYAWRITLVNGIRILLRTTSHGHCQSHYPPEACPAKKNVDHDNGAKIRHMANPGDNRRDEVANAHEENKHHPNRAAEDVGWRTAGENVSDHARRA
jgi:hypothetical protein